MPGINIAIILLMLICAYAATKTPSLISAAFLLGAFSFFLSLAWAELAAPDVSFTEAVVGAGVSTIFILLALFGSEHRIKQVKRPFPLTAFLSVAILATFFIWASLDLPALGDLRATASSYLSPYYLQYAYHDTKTPNVVTAVVVDYRGFDTLIESAVVFTAAVACLLIFRKEDEI